MWCFFGGDEMETIQIIRNDTHEIIASITDYPNGIKGIISDGYIAVVDGEELIIENRKSRPSGNDER